MKLDSYPEVLSLVQDVKSWLSGTDHESLIWFREGEPDPLSIDLSFKPPIAEKTVETLFDPDICTLCSRRIGYKPRQFAKTPPDLPYLILVHNSFILERAQYYEQPQLDRLFNKIIHTGLGVSPDRFLIREVLRCYFAKADETDPENIENCRKHIREDIDTYKIKGILILGQAAPLVFRQDMKKLQSIAGKVFELEGVPAIATSGPERILYMHVNKFDAQKIEAEKQRILNDLEIFKSDIMR